MIRMEQACASEFVTQIDKCAKLITLPSLAEVKFQKLWASAITCPNVIQLIIANLGIYLSSIIDNYSSILTLASNDRLNLEQLNTIPLKKAPQEFSEYYKNATDMLLEALNLDTNVPQSLVQNETYDLLTIWQPLPESPSAAFITGALLAQAWSYSSASKKLYSGFCHYQSYFSELEFQQASQALYHALQFEDQTLEQNTLTLAKQVVKNAAQLFLFEQGVEFYQNKLVLFWQMLVEKITHQQVIFSFTGNDNNNQEHV